jgi:hypothetical protein
MGHSKEVHFDPVQNLSHFLLSSILNQFVMQRANYRVLVESSLIWIRIVLQEQGRVGRRADLMVTMD